MGRSVFSLEVEHDMVVGLSDGMEYGNNYKLVPYCCTRDVCMYEARGQQEVSGGAST